MADVTFVPDAAGIREIARSEGMQAALREEAGRICAAANSDARTHEGGLHIRGGRFEVGPYGSSVDVLDNAAVGVVFTRTAVARMNEAKNKSLASQNH